MTAEERVIRFEEVKGYVTVQHGWWWLGMVISLDQREREVAINCVNLNQPDHSLTPSDLITWW